MYKHLTPSFLSVVYLFIDYLPFIFMIIYQISININSILYYPLFNINMLYIYNIIYSKLYLSLYIYLFIYLNLYFLVQDINFIKQKFIIYNNNFIRNVPPA